MAKKHFSRALLAVGFGLLGLGILPSVDNPTPARALDLGANSIDNPTSIWVVVNKARPLNPIKYKPVDLVVPGFGPLNANPYQHSMRRDVAAAAEGLAKSMQKAGKGRLVIQSAYRSYNTQKSVHDRQVSRFGLAAGEPLAARPGYSEHQTGLAIDVSARDQGCQIRVCFGGTKAGAWLKANAHRWGFIIRYPQNAMPVTGYQYEPWHLRYVGIELATDMKQKSISTLEKYFGLPSAPKYP
ncbi:MAG: D-alanyl-D-alanine carboxypeptidase family protein [Rhodoluna sp.]